MPDPPCHQESWGVVCSPWGFTEPYWKDGGRLGGGCTSGDLRVRAPRIRSTTGTMLGTASITAASRPRLH
ncbi:hypothetical protein HAZT_HAZT008232, partial [Hyalella azteca]